MAPAFCSASPTWGQSSAQSWRHEDWGWGWALALTSCSARTLHFGGLNLAAFSDMEICRVLCVPEAARRARSQARDFSTRPALLPPAGPRCSVPGSCCSSSCALLASTAPRHSSSPQALPPWAGTPALSSPASANAFPNSPSLLLSLLLCCRLRLSGVVSAAGRLQGRAIPIGDDVSCTVLEDIHLLCLVPWQLQESRCRLFPCSARSTAQLALLSPIAVPPAKVTGTPPPVPCKPGVPSRFLYCYRSFAEGKQL